MQLADLRGKKVAIWGAGVEASAVLHALDRSGIDASVVVTDDSPTGNATLEGRTILRGAMAVDALTAAEVIVRSPGVSPYRPDAQRVLAAADFHTTATRLWFAGDHASTIAVTGTKGKSTTASLIAHLLNALGVDARLAGNIGRSPLDYFGEPQPQWWVLELSSYQTSDLEFSPEVGVLTSLSPEHLDWHGSYESYVRDKLNLFKHRSDIRSVVNCDDAGATEVQRRLPGEVYAANTEGNVRVENGQFYDADEPLFSADALRLIGTHNRSLAATALTAIKAAGFDLVANRSPLAEALTLFEPLEYRLQPISDTGGVMWVDDGLSTTPVATMAALDAFADRPATVLVGGHDRGLDYRNFAEYVTANAERLTIITMPDSGDRIAAAISNRRLDSYPDLVVAATNLEEAVRLAADLTPVGGVVLLSPAAPSFGRFTSYKERSQAYRQAVAALD